MFDIIVVGAGMVGSATAFHASQIAGKSICLIGPPEPKIREGQEVFGSWFDEGRICRQIAGDRTWSVLAVKSMKRYRELEKQSGINFYTESGFAQVMQNRDDFHHAMKMIEQDGLHAEDCTKSWKKHFPYLNLPDDAYVIWERNISGYLNPRNLVKAHQKAAAENGAQIIHEIVSTICPVSSSTHRWEVMTEGGNVFHCNSVLVATGGYAGLKSNLFQHVAPNKVPDLDLRTQTVAFLRISSEEAGRLKSMPTMVMKYSFHNLDGAYILPPILYPDGKWYLKLGHGRVYECRKETLAEVADWYVQHTGDPECVEKLTQFLSSIILGLQVEEVSGDGCLTAHTPDEQPYIDLVTEGFGVALGGNGYAAKACSEIGRLAAQLVMLGEWESEIPRDQVKIKWKKDSKL